MRPVVALFLATALSWSASEPAAAAPRAVSPRGMLVQQLEIGASGARSGLLLAGYRGAGRERRWQLLARLGDRPLQRLDGSVFGPQIAVGADGTAIAAWIAGRSLRAAIARPGHGFGRSRTLATAPTDIPAGSTGMIPGGIAVGKDGAGVIAWRHGDGPSSVVRVAFRRGAGFAAPQTLGDSYYAPAVARTPDDAFVVAWQTRPLMPPPGVPPTLEGNPRVMLAVAVKGETGFGAHTMLAGPPDFLTTPPSAFTGPGGVSVAWQQQAARRVAVLASADSIETVDLGGPFGTGTEHADPVSVAMPSDRSAVAVWRVVRTRSAEDPTVVSSHVLAARRPAGDAFSASQALSTPSRLAGTPVAAAVRGRTVAAWSERAAQGGARLRIRVHDGHGWNAPETVASADVAGIVRLASAEQSAVLAWIARSGHGRGRVYLYDIPVIRG